MIDSTMRKGPLPSSIPAKGNYATLIDSDGYEFSETAGQMGIGFEIPTIWRRGTVPLLTGQIYPIPEVFVKVVVVHLPLFYLSKQ